ncbi:hypothetical protein QBC44DRAFT_243095 [Cladorrhinum sp. PSN332]|nr:hypothetical protein QBC44DRAFT_243095 [Cladorrhinum sp. PSN332]
MVLPGPRLLFNPPLPSIIRTQRPPPSHDTTFAGFHVTQQSFLRQLDLAVQAAWPSRHSPKYLEVKVLLMSWESDDLGVEVEVQRLESVFRDLYHFHVEYWKIPDRRSVMEATQKVLDFKKAGDNPDTLLIFYYAGHATLNPNQPMGLPTWIANRDPKSPRLDSSCIRPLLCQVDDSSPDTLLLYDCCHPANGHGSIESSQSSVELLAACGFEATAAEVGEHSFTDSLIQELSDAIRRQEAISIPELHCRQISRLQTWTPSVQIAFDQHGKQVVRTTRDGLPVFEKPVRKTPVYCRLSMGHKPRPILLSPLNISEKLDGNTEFITLNSITMPSGDTSEANSAADGNDDLKGKKIPQLKVLLAVNLLEDQYNEAEFKEWITSAPAAAKGIRVLGALPGCSTILLIRAPMDVWGFMPPSPAITFIGFVPPDRHYDGHAPREILSKEGTEEIAEATRFRLSDRPATRDAAWARALVNELIARAKAFEGGIDKLAENLEHLDNFADLAEMHLEEWEEWQIPIQTSKSRPPAVRFTR